MASVNIDDTQGDKPCWNGCQDWWKPCHLQCDCSRYFHGIEFRKMYMPYRRGRTPDSFLASIDAFPAHTSIEIKKVY